MCLREMDETDKTTEPTEGKARPHPLLLTLGETSEIITGAPMQGEELEDFRLSAVHEAEMIASYILTGLLAATAGTERDPDGRWTEACRRFAGSLARPLQEAARTTHRPQFTGYVLRDELVRLFAVCLEDHEDAV